MSEYQYYEFLAVDRPLTNEEIQRLRRISTRAKITSQSFVNEYNWGDLKANPRDFMREYFDVHVYLANWGDAILMVRLPRDAMDRETLDAFQAVPYLEYAELPGHWLVTWSLGETEDYDRFYDVLEDGWMIRLAPVREELLRGDVRSLYIGWLRAVTLEMVDSDALEPMAVAGLNELTEAQQALAEYLEVDTDLLEGAGIGSPARTADTVDEAALDTWLEKLPREEVLDCLKQVMNGRGMQAGRALKRKFDIWRAKSEPETRGTPRRVAELLDLAGKIREQRLEKEEMALRKAEAKRKREREAMLAGLAGDFPGVWKTVREHALRGTAYAYDEATRLLVDLRDAYSLHATPEAFQDELERFMTEHQRRRALMDRIIRAGLRRAD